MQKNFIQVPVVAGVLIEKEGKFLLVQEKQERVYGLWNFPAGLVDIGESIEEAAVREAFEETGFTVQLNQKIDIFQNTATEPPKHIFVAKITSGEINFPKDEILDVSWFSYEEIIDMKGQLRNTWILEAIEIYKNLK